jgi:hypothetical protein
VDELNTYFRSINFIGAQEKKLVEEKDLSDLIILDDEESE